MVSTRARPYVLDFLIDDESDCALTVLEPRSHCRYHVIAAKEKLQPLDGSKTSKASQELDALVKAVKSGGSEKRIISNGKADSGVDLADCANPETTLQDWMLATVPFEIGSKSDESEESTLREWLDADIRFFQLQVDEEWERLEAVELEDSTELRNKIPKSEHEISLPKYILKHDLPWYNASDLVVIDCSDAPPPYHPTRVRIANTGETFFFKAVDGEAPKVTKRELSLLQKVAQAPLRNKTRTPTLKGLVASSNSKTSAIGFLQSEIHDATPLTLKLDSDVPQNKREKWAKEVAEMKESLHEHDIIWGDAKADNFLVDADETLWMIDFGGSYTEGWVDKELNETEEGDTMGIDKIVNALKDPEANTMDPDEDKISSKDSASLFVTKQSSTVQKALDERKQDLQDEDPQNGDTPQGNKFRKNKRAFEEVQDSESEEEMSGQPPLKQVHQAMANPSRAARADGNGVLEGEPSD